MQWIGGPSKDLGGQDASNKITGFASQGSSRTEGMASQAALRSANKEGHPGGGGEGGGEGGGGANPKDIESAVTNALNKHGGGAGSQPEGETPIKPSSGA